MIFFKTERLVLRMWKEKDVDAMAAIDQDPKVCEFLPGIGNRAATEAGVRKIMQHHKEHGYGLYAVELKSTHECIGWTGLAIPSFEAHFTPAVEIGWRLASEHWNKGYATEAAKAVLHYAFTELNLNEIVSFTVVNNKASRRVMEKIGLHHDPKDDFNHPKIEKDSPLNRHVLYRLTKSEYLKQCEKTAILFDIGNIFLTGDIIHNDLQENIKAIKILPLLRNRYKLIAVTDASISQMDYEIREFAFYQQFNDIIISEQCGFSKSNSNLYKFILEKHGLIASETVFVDDRIENTSAAKKVGIQTIHYITLKNLLNKFKQLNIIYQD